MNKEQIKRFLKTKPGYLKEGHKRLARVLNKKGYNVDFKDCKDALRESRLESKRAKYNNEDPKVLIYDIETSPNIGWFWRAGFKQNIGHHQIMQERAIICVSYKWLGEDQVYNLAWDKSQNDYFLLEQFIEVLNQADLIVAHNGDNFDLKWLKTRALYHGLPMLINYPQFDTLKVAKKKFYFNSNRLDYIAKFLGFEGKIETTPDLWKKVIMGNDREALNDMLEYCDEDVRQLEKVYVKLSSWELPKMHAGVIQGKTKLTSPHTGSVNIELVKTVTTNRGTIKHIMKDLDSNKLFEMSDTNYKKYKKDKD